MSSYFPPITITTTGGTGTSSSVDVDIVLAIYEVITAGTGTGVGDVLQKISYIKTSDQTAAASDKWINLTTQLTLSTAPGVSAVKPRSAGGASSGELSAVVLTSKEDATSPTFTHLGKITDTATPDGTGDYSLISGMKRLVLTALSALSKMPTLVSGKVPITGTLDEWQTVEYQLDSQGRLIMEKEKNGSVTRTRLWNTSTDAQGNTSYIAGEWA